MPLRILALEPYYGGSHRAFLDGYRRGSRHVLELLTMPARKWKWRMRGAALYMSQQVRERKGEFDLLLASDYLDLAALRALAPDALRGVPLVAYFHENQITYPLSREDERDYQFGFTNLTTCLAADRVLFNSRYHMESFLEAAADLLGQMPDFVPDWAPERIRARSDVMPVGVDLGSIDRQRDQSPPRTGPLTILWNHRWEYDKGPEAFFEVTAELARSGREFRLAVTGQQFRDSPDVFERTRRELADRLEHWGYVEGRDDYCRVLLGSDVAVSTARQEFFGISAVEAAYAGCAPLLPDRLSYPELVPPEWHETCLYADGADLYRRLAHWTEHPEEARSVDLREAFGRFGWDRVAPRLDDVLQRVHGGGP
ncbi:MAG: DUF3524 domain-containing protein [Candidatus Brocadiia bacterium]